MIKGKRILICPLDWGLGHATRCIPLINKLHEEGNTVLIAGDGLSGELLKKEFPSLPYIHFPSFKITYSKKKSQVLSILLSLPSLLYFSIREHYTLKKIIQTYQLDIILSDNRFGLWNKKGTTAYITHQLHIKLPKSLRFMEGLVWYMHRVIIEKYTYCIIPDYADATLSLAGELVHKYNLPRNAFFCNPLSRLHKKTPNTLPSEQFQSEILVVLSGIEPQRSILEKELLKQLTETGKKCILIQGLPNKEKSMLQIGNISMIPYVLHKELQQYVSNTDRVICRSGYSSIMDLVASNKKAIIIPTPGQPEQEYLASYLHNKGFFIAQTQHKLSIEEGLKNLEKTEPPVLDSNLILPF